MDKPVLPSPPPPRPDRREAAISAALHRFDGAEADHAAVPKPRRPRFAWTLRNRPQLGVLVAASLVAVVCLPVLWVVRGNPQPEGAKSVALETFEHMPRAERRAPAAMADDVAADAAEPAPSVSPPEVVMEEAPPPPPAIVAAMDYPAPPPAPVEVLAPALAPALPSAPPPPPPPPPPAPVAREAARESAIAMSAMRTRDAAKVARRETAMRGDWNACTLDDPSPDLTLCKGEIWASADGRSGRAGAFLADGLRAGWQGDLDTAISAFTRAVETDPRRADAYVNRGLAYQRKGDLDRALADLDRAVKRAPKAARGYYLRSLVLHERGDTDGAREDEERAAALDPAYAQRIEAGARN